MASAPDDAAALRVEVAYALPERQTVIELMVPAGTTCRQAIERSGILEAHPDIDITRCAIGVYGEVCDADRLVEADDRVEIYRPLAHDPREQRRARVQAERRRKG